MWQRVQTVFLALTAVAMVVALFFPVWVAEVNGQLTQVLTPLMFQSSMGTDTTISYWPYSIMAMLMVASATLSVTALTKYKNRLLQVKLGAFNSLLMAVVVLSEVLFVNKLTDITPTGWRYGLALFIPMASVLFNFLANRFIRRDERLVRDSERLR
jgi:Domain of unknown function (DUF4293)